jgi:hypothetical protein
MEKYEALTLEVIRFETEDIITTSILDGLPVEEKPQG